MTTFETSQLDNGNGHHLALTWFRPHGEPRATVLIAPAMAVEQQYYASFAQWLATHGYLVVTFDYAGMGQSSSGPLREVDVDILDWARFDCSAVLKAATAAAGDNPLYWIGHSLGAQILPFVEGRERITKVLTIAAGSGYWRENSLPLRRRVWLFWYLLTPLLTPLVGYFPGKRIGMVGDLPKGVIRQWRRWCLNPEYAVGAEGDRARSAYAAVETPIVSFSFTDDEMMSRRNTESLHGFYRQAPKAFKRFAPQEIGAKRIGHFGFFRPNFEEALWRPHLLPELG